MSEKDWQQLVVDMARVCGWWPFHVFDSRRSAAGWPDLVLVRPPDCLFVELKRDDGKVSAPQARVLDLLEQCGLEVHVWRPANEQHIRDRLAPVRTRS